MQEEVNEFPDVLINAKVQELEDLALVEKVAKFEEIVRDLEGSLS